MSNGHELDTRLLRFRSRPGSEDATKLAGDLLIANRTTDALEVTSVGLRATPDDLELLLVDSRAEMIGGDLLKAQAALLKAARVGTTRKEPFRYLGEVLLKRGDPARAAKVLERAKGIDGTDRAITALHERALRLARIAETDGDRAAEESRASFVPAKEEPREERTVLRSGLTERLASVTRDRAEALLGPPAAEADEHGPAFEEDEDEVTQIVGALPQIPARPLPPPKAPPPMSARPLPAAPPMSAPPMSAPPMSAAPMSARPLPAAPPMSARPLPVAPPPGALSPFPPKAARAPTSPGGFIAPVRPGEGPRQAGHRDSAPDRADSLDAPIFGSAPQLSDPFAPPADAAFAPAGDFEEPATEERALDQDPGDPEERAGDFGRDLGPGGDYAAGGFGGADDLAPETAPDEPVGELAGVAEDVDAVLAMLQREGLFEPPTGDAGVWSKRKEFKIEKTRIGAYLGVAWVLALGAAAGSWFGWQEYVRQNHVEAARLVDVARAEARSGDHESLVDAERHLREARDLDPHAPANSSVLLFVHTQRALEDGAFEIGFLAPTLARAERGDADDPFLHAARGVIAMGGGNVPQTREEIAAMLAAAPEDASILYVVGRLEQRLGEDEALTHLEAATQHDPELGSAAIALAEARHDEGRHEDALTLLDAVLSHDGENLRAKLWRGFLTSDDDDIDSAFATLTEIEPRLVHGAPTDHVLYQLTRSRLLRRQGHHDEAGEAVELALNAGAQEPRLLGLVAQAARAANRYLQAEYAATEAVRGSPTNPEFRKLLANIYLDRRNGPRALSVLTQLPPDDPDVLSMSARAALLVGSDEALAMSAGAIDEFVEGHPDDVNVDLQALRIRLAVAGGGDPAPTLAAARQLARDNPGDSVPALALGEAALRAHDSEEALRALQIVVRTSPDSAEGYYLLGRAHRMQGDGAEAIVAFRHAIELSAELMDAKVTLAGVLMDTGDFAAADVIYVELARTAGYAMGMSLGLTGRLGRVEALIALGRLDDAQVQLESVRGTDRTSSAGNLTGAHLAMAQGHFGDAVRALRPLSEVETPAASVVAAYGDALLGAGEVDASAAAFDRALTIDANLPEALLGRAELYVRGESERDAAPLLERATASLTSRIRPPSLHARLGMLRGRVLLAAHDTSGARDALTEASTMAGAPSETWFFLGEVLSGARAPEARAAYEHYLEVAPSGTYADRARRAVQA